MGNQYNPMYDPFQPTLPLRGATCVNVHLIFCCQSFNPRSPCGERRAALVVQRGRLWFQPTLPLRGATAWTWTLSVWERGFNPRSPCGERPSMTAR